jgi:TrpR-related protein YerC/YecD
MPSAIETKYTELLIEILLSLETREECYKLLADLCTIREVKDMGQRIEVARLLKDRMTYAEISQLTGASTATISRVNRCLLYGEGGYDMALGRMNVGK